MTPARPGVAAVLAAAGPGALVSRALRRGRWSPPPSATGKAMLTGYVLAVALIEETLYRGPVSRYAGQERRVAALVTASLSVAGFVALHVRRDGARTFGAHLVNAGCWTASAFAGRSLRWSIAAHSAYNYAAMSLRARA
jgi:CAAX prenyl protease-like protein